MKILYITYHGFSPFSGISKKMLAQIDGLRQNGHEVHVCSYDIDEKNGHRCRYIDGLVLEDFGSGKLAALKKRISYDTIFDYCIQTGIEAAYVRSFHNANPWTINLFRKLRKAGISSVMEIPTYPYDSEYDNFGFLEKLSLKIDQVYRRDLAREMDGIVTFSDAETIFGQRTICISNGIDFDAIEVRKQHTTSKHELHLLGVAEVHLWHAYDRVIHGLADYYGNGDVSKEVFFHIVGGVCDKDMQEWSVFIQKRGIEKYVIFHGQQFGEELTRLFNIGDLGIGSLGRHRSGIDKIKTLKNREYAARGLSFIYSETDDDFEHMPYIMKVPADESAINIPSLIDFASRQTMSPTQIRNTVLHLSWKEQMKKVFSGK